MSVLCSTSASEHEAVIKLTRRSHTAEWSDQPPDTSMSPQCAVSSSMHTNSVDGTRHKTDFKLQEVDHKATKWP